MTASRSPRRGRLLLAAVAGLLLVVIAVGAGVITFVLRGDGGADPVPTAAPTQPPEPTLAAPEEPGVEPPEDGEWPGDWPTFESGEPVVELSDLEGLGFGFTAPEGWTCDQLSVTDGEAHYRCAGPGPGEIGGDLVVRDCPDPCDADRRVDMRMAEEAWGLQWVRDGGYWCWADSAELHGEDRYGLVFVGYWRSQDEGRLDRQVVFRMSGPVERADDLRKFANAVRDQIR